MPSLMKMVGSQSFLLGVGVAAAAYLIGPQIRESLKPAAVKGAQGIMVLGGKTKQALEQGKEKLNDMVFDKSGMETKNFQEKLLQELREEREASNRILEELKNSITGLKEEISSIKNGSVPQQ